MPKFFVISDIHSFYEPMIEAINNTRFDPYYGDGFIAIDACTAYSGKCNVIVLEDDFLEGNDNV